MDETMKKNPDSLKALSAVVRKFADERDWDQFHSPKNLSMALIVEAGELVEHFQWLTQSQSRQPDAEQQQAIALEMADVLIYLVRLADQLDIDLLTAARKKIAINAAKYPVEQAKGRAEKYNRLGQKP